MQTLAAVNNLANPSFIRVGQVLTIPGTDAAPIPANPQPEPVPAAPPPADSKTYVVQQGDTLYIIARKFGVTVRAIATANQIQNHNLIYPGQTLIISAENPAPAEPDPDAVFIWPVSSRSIVKRYLPGHRAIDIVVASGTAVQAMAAGKIEYAGWNNYGYGNLVVVDHGNGWRTLYAHNSEFAVKTGDAVGQGDVIAYSGNTGRSSMPHIHLEMMLNFAAVNPCLHLPGGC
jgi:murein DD-endopeptidase MepM/ murein hydrolase activator NlpD